MKSKLIFIINDTVSSLMNACMTANKDVMLNGDVITVGKYLKYAEERIADAKNELKKEGG